MNHVGQWMLQDRQSAGSTQCVSASSWQMDSILPVMRICVQGRTAGQRHRPYDRPADLYSRPRLGPPLMTSTDSSSREHVQRFAATLKLPLVCLKILTRVQIRAKRRVPPSTMCCMLIKLIWFSSQVTVDLSLGLMHHILVGGLPIISSTLNVEDYFLEVIWLILAHVF